MDSPHGTTAVGVDDWDAVHHHHHHHPDPGSPSAAADAAAAALPPLPPPPPPPSLLAALLSSLLGALTRVLRVPLASGALGFALGALAAVAVLLISAAQRQTRTAGGAPLAALAAPALLPSTYNFSADMERGWGYISDPAQWDAAALGPLIGPAQWPALPAFPLCAGDAQSPAALSNAAAASGGTLQLRWRYNASAPFRVAPREGKPGFEVDHLRAEDDGAGAEWVPPPAGASSGTPAPLPAAFVDFHFHAPSEHTLNGERFALEGHFVHRSEATRAITVLGILFRLDAEGQRPNPHLRAIWPDIFFPEAEPLHAPLNYSAFVADLEPAAYCYSGSLTTPPCSAASWCVAVARTPVNTEQLAAFAYRMGNAPTNRPLQPLNGRTVVRYSLPPGAVAAPP